MTTDNKLSTITTTARQIRRAPIMFTGNEHHLVSLDDALSFTENYRRSVPQGSLLGGRFSREIFGRILTQPTCVGIRIYLGCRANGSPTLILAGANARGNDLYEGALGADPLMTSLSFSEQLSERDAASARISGTENHLTTLAEAGQLTRKYRESLRGAAGKGGYFGRNIFDKILASSECRAIRIYHAQMDDGRPTFVLAGVDGSGLDITRGPLGENTMWCPPWCASLNPLNH